MEPSKEQGDQHFIHDPVGKRRCKRFRHVPPNHREMLEEIISSCGAVGVAAGGLADLNIQPPPQELISRLDSTPSRSPSVVSSTEDTYRAQLATRKRASSEDGSLSQRPRKIRAPSLHQSAIQNSAKILKDAAATFKEGAYTKLKRRLDHLPALGVRCRIEVRHQDGYM